MRTASTNRAWRLQRWRRRLPSGHDALPASEAPGQPPEGARGHAPPVPHRHEH